MHGHEIGTRVQILGFVSTSELSWIHLDRPYYISSPDENSRLYTVLREILVRSDRLAVGQLVLRRRRQLVAIYGFRGALVMHTLRASTDILDPRDTRDWLIQSLDVHRMRLSGGVGLHRLSSWPTTF